MQFKKLPARAIIVALATLTWAPVTTGAVYRIVKSFPAPTGTQPNGLAWDGRYLWMSSYMRNGGIYKLNPEDGSVLGIFTPPVAPSEGYSGLTFDGTYLWHTTFYSDLMDKLALPDLVVVSRIPCPKFSPGDLAWDGSSLWTCDGGHSPRLYQVDPGTGEVLLQFDVPGTGQSQLAGLAYGGPGREPGCLWLSWRSEIFKIDPTDGHIIARMPAPCTRAESLAWDSSYLWVASFNQGIIYQMEIAQPTGRVIYVDDDASGTNNGLSWDSAYKYLQDALEEARYGNEIRVAQGIYKPDRELMSGRGVRVGASGDRMATFQLKNGVTIKGGYAGGSQPNPDIRDINLYKTILRGDLNGDDGPNFTNNFENSYHVVTGTGTNETAVLDGFTITGGNANGPSPHDHGGGMFNSTGNPTVINCNFNKNSALQHGGGMDNSDSHPKLTNCTFIGNAVELKYGGGISNYNSTPNLINCIFIGNSSESQGGAMFNNNYSDASLTNCTFSANIAFDGGGIVNALESNPTLTNCIIWGNLAIGEVDESAQIQGGTPVINYCCINGWTGMLGGTGNHGLDPLFVDGGGLDNIPGTEDDNLHLLEDSHCINAGDNSAIPQSIVADLDGNPRIINGTVDMGAYESNVNITDNIHYVDEVNEASNPYPADGAVDVMGPLTFTWTAGVNAVSHYIYYGFDKDVVECANTSDTTSIYRGYQTETSYTPPEGIRLSSTPYYWRIDEIDYQGNTTKGDVWTFTTIPPPPPKGRACFLPEIPALVEGKLVQIQNVTASGSINSVEEHEGTFICHDIVLESGNTISVVDAHCFMTDSGQWITTQNLTTKLRLRTMTGTIGIKSITTRSHIGRVYNLKIRDSDQYMVSDDMVIVRDY